MALYYISGKSLRLGQPLISSLFCRNQGFAVAASHFGRRLISSSRIPPGQEDSTSTISYIITSCGLSSEAAIESSYKVKLKSLEKPDSVLALLREYEFSDTQISTLVRNYPQVILADAQKTLLPKLEFLSSIGISRLDLAKTLVYNPYLLTRSLENVFRPGYSFLKSLGLSDVMVIKILKRNSSIFGPNLSKNVIPNVGFVRELGMPQSRIAQMVTHETRLLMFKPEFFSQLVGQVQQMGFHPQMSSFVHAMSALCLKRTTWKRCEEAYRSWGWSDDDILSAFRLWPLCMIVSEKKIMATMDLFVNKMGWHAHKIAKLPNLFSYSLEKRIIPRCSVVKVLLLKGLIEEKKLSLSTLSSISEEYFLNRFVTRYLDQVPQLSDVYHGKMDAQDV